MPTIVENINHGIGLIDKKINKLINDNIRKEEQAEFFSKVEGFQTTLKAIGMANPRNQELQKILRGEIIASEAYVAAKGIAQLITIKSTTISAWAPHIAAAGIAAMSFINLFDNSNSNADHFLIEIAENLQAIFNQIDKLREQIFEGFTAVIDNQRELYKTQIIILRAIKNGFFYLEKDLHNSIQNLDFMVKNSLNKVQSSVIYYGDTLSYGQQNFSNKEFRRLLFDIGEFEKTSHSEVNADLVTKYLNDLYYWITCESKTPFNTGAYLLPREITDNDYALICKNALSENSIDDQIGFLAPYAHYVLKINVPNLNAVFNPTIWLTGVEHFIELAKLHNSKIDLEQKINSLIQMANDKIAYITSLQSNKIAIFSALFQFHKQAVNSIVSLIDYEIEKKNQDIAQQIKLRNENSSLVVNINLDTNNAVTIAKGELPNNNETKECHYEFYSAEWVDPREYRGKNNKLYNWNGHITTWLSITAKMHYSYNNPIQPKLFSDIFMMLEHLDLCRLHVDYELQHLLPDENPSDTFHKSWHSGKGWRRLLTIWVCFGNERHLAHEIKQHLHKDTIISNIEQSDNEVAKIAQQKLSQFILNSRKQAIFNAIQKIKVTYSKLDALIKPFYSYALHLNCNRAETDILETLWTSDKIDAHLHAYINNSNSQTPLPHLAISRNCDEVWSNLEEKMSQFVSGDTYNTCENNLVGRIDKKLNKLELLNNQLILQNSINPQLSNQKIVVNHSSENFEEKIRYGEEMGKEISRSFIAANLYHHGFSETAKMIDNEPSNLFCKSNMDPFILKGMISSILSEILSLNSELIGKADTDSLIWLNREFANKLKNISEFKKLLKTNMSTSSSLSHYQSRNTLFEKKMNDADYEDTTYKYKFR